jgi:diaminopimelate epimerase
MKKITIPFTKMHGLGNDFVVINTLNQSLPLHSSFIRDLAHRHVGIGFDQLLVIEPSKQADFFCRIFNADGSEAEQCGNGLRCVARFIHEEKIKIGNSLKLETLAGVFPLTIEDYEHISTVMGTPYIINELIELNLVEVNKCVAISVISTGNPHAIAKVESIEKTSITLAQQISTHPFFANGINVGFMQIVNNRHVKLRTIERGVGETYACGSNACAAAVAGITNGWLEDEVRVEFKHGDLMIQWGGDHLPIYMTGPATKVFSGFIEV